MHFDPSTLSSSRSCYFDWICGTSGVVFLIRSIGPMDTLSTALTRQKKVNERGCRTACGVSDRPEIQFQHCGETLSSRASTAPLQPLLSMAVCTRCDTRIGSSTFDSLHRCRHPLPVMTERNTNLRIKYLCGSQDCLRLFPRELSLRYSFEYT